MADTVIATNRQARHAYTIYESIEAGIALVGPEVKSLRAGQANLREGFARADGGELFLYNTHIAPYEFGNIANPDPVRPRKLLLHKRQIRHLIDEVATKKLALIPLKMYFKNGVAKVELGLAKGKKLYDKRDAVKKREMDRELKRQARG